MEDIGLVILFIFILGISLLCSRGLFGSFLAPIGIYAAVWTVAAILYVLSPFPWPQSLGMRTVSAIILSVGGFLGGAIGSKTIRRRYSFESVTSQEGAQRSQLQERLFRISTILFGFIGIFGAVALLMKMISTFGLNTYLTDPGYIRYQVTLSSEFQIGRIFGTYLLAFSFAGVFMGATYISYFSPNYLPAYIPLASVFLYDLAILGRWKMVGALTIYWFGYLLGKRDVDGTISARDFASSPDAFLLVNIVGLLIFVPLTLLEGGSQYYFAKYTSLNTFLAEAVLRLNIPIQGLIVTVQYPSPQLSGQFMLNPIADLLSRAGLTDSQSLTPYLMRQNPLAPWGERYLAISDLAGMYLDFGWLGIICIPMIISFLMGYWYLGKGPYSLVFLLTFYGEITWFQGWYFSLPFYLGAVLLLSIVVLLFICIEYSRLVDTPEGSRGLL